MSTNVYAPRDCNLIRYGFRWCNKDSRWERRKTMEDADARQLAEEVGYKVEIKDKSGILTITPTGIGIHIESTRMESTAADIVKSMYPKDH